MPFVEPDGSIIKSLGGTIIYSKYGRMATLFFNVYGSVNAINNFVLIAEIPRPIEPIAYIVDNYVTQEGKTALLDIDVSKGGILVHNLNVGMTNTVIRKTVTYITKY